VISVIYDEFPSLLSEAAIAALRERSGFRSILESAAQAAVDHYLQADAAIQWMMKDVGRTAIGLTALVLRGAPGGLTAAALRDACLAGDISSSGRVMDFINHGCRTGALIAHDGPGHWTHRPIGLGPGLLDTFRRRAQIDLEAVARLYPEVSPAIALTDQDGGFEHYIGCAAVLSAAQPDLFAAAPRGPTHLFLDRDVGMLLLFDLMTAQPEPRERLLESAPLSRAALSRRFGVSRAHINKLLADADREGLLCLPHPDRVVFAPALSEGVERQCAIVMRLTQAAALMALATRPNSQSAEQTAGGPVEF
jgi:hypothetical protein